MLRPPNVIALPTRHVSSDPTLSRIRVAVAVAKLQAALEEQNRAVHQWRESLAELQQSVALLGSTMRQAHEEKTSFRETEAGKRGSDGGA